MKTELTQRGNKEDFSDFIAEIEQEVASDGGGAFSDGIVALVRRQGQEFTVTSKKNDQKGDSENQKRTTDNHKQVFQWAETAREFVHLLPKETSQMYQAIILDCKNNPRKRYTVGLVQDSRFVQAKTAISRLLQQFSTNAIDFVPLDPIQFNYLFSELYSVQALLKKQDVADKTRVRQTRQWGGRVPEAVEGNDAPPEKAKTIEDFAGKRLDCSNLAEYERISRGFEAGTINEEELDILEFVTYMLQDFIKSGGSDLHINCSSAFGGVIRYRFEGKCYTRWENIPLHRTSQIVNSLCILGNKNHGDLARESVGTILKLQINYGGEVKNAQFRFQSTPSSPLPTVVVRGQPDPIRDINKLGFYEDQLDQLGAIIEAENGIVLVTGATGSGKTNTLESLMAILEEEYIWNIIEVGDPCEIESARRVQITLAVTATKKKDQQYEEAFADCLRLDPDIIYFTELRTPRVASTALDGSISGHQVFTTLHAADVEETLTRLYKMGLPLDLLAKGVLAIISQRLVRKLCEMCKIEDSSASILAGKTIYRENDSEKCPHCTKGFAGRTAVAEILIFNETVRGWVMEGKKPAEIVVLAAEKGIFQPLKRIALRKVLDGVTSEFEVRHMVDLQFGQNETDVFNAGEVFDDSPETSFVIDAEFTDV